MLSRDEVIWLYRCVLGREPESEDTVELNRSMYSTFNDARTAFIESREFRLAAFGIGNKNIFYRSARARSFSKPANQIGLISILKNEADRVALMLHSVIPLVDFVVLVDTGSTDRTIDVCNSILSASNIDFVLEQTVFEDFAQARNLALSLLPNRIEWALALDADEHIVQEDYQRFVDLTDIMDVDAWNLPRYNFVDVDKLLPVDPYPDFQSRLFRHRNVAPIYYAGPVHEVLVGVRHWGTAPINGEGQHSPCGGPHIHHMGQVNLSIERWSEKHSLYERLARKK